jgi:hypothetical protein
MLVITRPITEKLALEDIGMRVGYVCTMYGGVRELQVQAAVQYGTLVADTRLMIGTHSLVSDV